MLPLHCLSHLFFIAFFSFTYLNGCTGEKFNFFSFFLFSAAFFIRPFYKMMLGKPITLVDMESVVSRVSAEKFCYFGLILFQYKRVVSLLKF